MAVPASLYVPSARRWSGQLRSPEYASGVAVRRGRTNGGIKWRGELVWISSALGGEPVGIEEGADGRWQGGGWAGRPGPIRARARPPRAPAPRRARALRGLPP